MAKTKEVEIDCTVTKETPRAYLVDFGGENPVWVPRSQISDEGINPDGSVYSIFIPEWLAKKEGMI